MAQSRSLSETERFAVPRFIAASIDLERVRIRRRRWTFLTPRRTTVCRGYDIFWPDAPDEARTAPLMAHLIHELVHVWQYKTCGVGMYSLRWLDRRYRYQLIPDKPFLSYGLEQQAAIIEDDFRLKQKTPTRFAKSSYEPADYDRLIGKLDPRPTRPAAV